MNTTKMGIEFTKYFNISGMSKIYKIQVVRYVYQRADDFQQAVKRARKKGSIKSQEFIINIDNL